MELQKITEDNLWDVVALSVSDAQKSFVATNTQSILEAYVTVASGGVALPFGLYEDGALVGFIMFGFTPADRFEDGDPVASKGNYCIWRFMIDRNHQRKGLGKKALRAALDYLKTYPCGAAESCWLSYEPENTVARRLYHAFGFEENGEQCDGEIIAVRTIGSRAD